MSQKNIAIKLLLGTLLVLSCISCPNTSSPVAIAIAPAQVTLAFDGTQQFTSAVAGSPNTSVTWSVQEGSSGGTISTSGLYTAPATSGTYHAVATSAADPTASAIATVTVSASAPTVSVSLNPTSATVSTGGTQQFNATVTGAAITSVTWSVFEGSTGGTISATGFYFAPATAGTYHVIAISVADSSLSAIAAVKVTAPVSSISVSIAPAFVTIAPAATQQLTKTVTGTTDTSVTWVILEGSNGGTITSAGLYTAPAMPGTYHVVSTSVTDPTASATATVIVKSVLNHSGTISANETWNAGALHIVQNNLTVNGGATLTIEAGAVIQVNANAYIRCGYSSSGSIIAVGTAASPIVFTSAQPTPLPGDWDTLIFYNNTLATAKLNYCVVEYGGGVGTNPANIHLDTTGLEIQNCAIRYSEGYGITHTGTGHVTNFTGNTISDCGNYPLNTAAEYVGLIGTGNTFTDNTPNAIRVDADTIATSATWRNLTIPYVISGLVYIGNSTNNPLVTIEPGTTLKFAGTGAGIWVGKVLGNNLAGGLLADGTTSPITFTSNTTLPGPGDWGALSFYGGTLSSSVLKGCVVEYGGSSSGNIYLEKSLVIQNCTIRYSEGYGITYGSNGHVTNFTGNTISNCGNYPLSTAAEYVGLIGTGNTFTDNTPNAIRVDTDTIATSATWRNLTIPYVISGLVYIGNSTNNPLVTIEPGTTLKFAGTGAGIWVGKVLGNNLAGGLLADGTTSPITFTSNTTLPGPGDWGALSFYGGTLSSSVLKGCVVEYGGSSSGNIYLEKSLVIQNCTIRHSQGYGITYGSNGHVTNFTGNTISNCGNYPLSTAAEYVGLIGTGNTFTDNTPNAIRVDTDTVATSATWRNLTIPYVINGMVYIGNSTNNPLVTIEPGTTLKFAGTGAGIRVGQSGGTLVAGGLLADGTTSPITFTSNTTPPSPGSWASLSFSGSTLSSSALKGCVVEYGGSGVGNIYIENTMNILITGCTIRNSATWGISLSGTHPAAVDLQNNNTFASNGSGSIRP